MNEKEITKDLIRALMFFGIVRGWKISKLIDEYERLGIPKELVNDTLNEGCE
ncbi:MAG: hypothetical protein LUE65_01235 [Clostridiales bacterium]|nr:hypothetical protein [Clostridiales bacterium]